MTGFKLNPFNILRWADRQTLRCRAKKKSYTHAATNNETDYTAINNFTVNTVHCI